MPPWLASSMSECKVLAAHPPSIARSLLSVSFVKLDEKFKHKTTMNRVSRGGHYIVYTYEVTPKSYRLRFHWFLLWFEIKSSKSIAASQGVVHQIVTHHYGLEAIHLRWQVGSKGSRYTTDESENPMHTWPLQNATVSDWTRSCRTDYRRPFTYKNCATWTAIWARHRWKPFWTDQRTHHSISLPESLCI